MTRIGAFGALVALLTTLAWTQQAPPPMSSLERARALDILQVVSGDVRKYYYDPKFHGVDFDAKIAEAKRLIETETSFNMSMSHIAAALASLNDSHTFLVPPQHAYHLDYGFRYEIVGDRCFVTRVRPKSDADQKGVKPGDEIVAIDGHIISRADYWKAQYILSILRPQPALRLVLQDPTGAQRQIDVNSNIHETKRLVNLTFNGNSDFWDLLRERETERQLMRARYYEVGDQLLVLKVPEFYFSSWDLDGMIGKARKHQNLIVDLRSNPGGSVELLKGLIGAMFDRNIKVADRLGRKETRPEVAKGTHHPFDGKIAVLVDSNSASAAELFARVMQIEKRGVVIGDRTSGSVMESKHFQEKQGTDTVVFFGASITEWDLIMTDGKSLEHVGVIPDEVVLPTPQDLASDRDPVLARAAEILGVKLTPEEAGKAFPYEWPSE